MGKKGKGKKEKITGTPEVIKFKGQREFFVLRECVSIQESLPFVAADALDDVSFKKVVRFLNLVGILAEYTKAEESKDYRFILHHHLLEPIPQYYPSGYTSQAIKDARSSVENTHVSFNGKEFAYPEGMKEKADKFLREMDSSMTKVASFIEPSLKDDFSQGLKKFMADLQDLLKIFDKHWIDFEKSYLEFIYTAHQEIFQPIEELINIEQSLTEAEEEGDIPMKKN